MAINEKQRQKKLAKKNKKRKQVKKSLNSGAQLAVSASNFVRYPVYECLVPGTIFEFGIGNVIVARKLLDGSIAISAFVVDVYCLGIKNALFKIVSEFEYEHSMKPGLMNGIDDQKFNNVDISCARKLVEGAALYAKDLGFSPHSDYKEAKGIFGNAHVNDCPVDYEFGKSGKPLYIRGPNESNVQAKMIIEQLQERCGSGEFNYVLEVGGF